MDVESLEGFVENFFSLRVIGEGNRLLQEVVEAPSTNAFKNKLDRHWNDMGAVD